MRRGIWILALVLVAFGAAPAFSQESSREDVEAFLRRVTLGTPAGSEIKIAFDFDAEVLASAFFTDVRCAGKGSGSFVAEAGAFAVRIETAQFSCPAAGQHRAAAENFLNEHFRGMLSMPHVEKIAGERGMEFVVLLPDEALGIARGFHLREFREGSAMLAGANAELAAFIQKKVSSYSKRDAILQLGIRGMGFHYATYRKEDEKIDFKGMYGARVDIDWGSGRLQFLSISHTDGDTELWLDYAEVAGNWVWKKLAMTGPVVTKDFSARIELTMNVGNFRTP